MHKCKCENCGVYFERSYKRRFCNLNCWHKFNAKKIASYNDTRFKWESASEQDKLHRIRRRFEEKVKKKEGCWEWSGYFDKDGYGLLNSGNNGKGYDERRAHRISWRIHKGEIPEGKYVCHTCDNPKCTNPEHLFLGTSLENNHDKVKKGRGNKGSKHGNSKLKEEQVKQIKIMYREGYKVTFLMEKFNSSRMNIHSIGKNKAWKHVIV